MKEIVNLPYGQIFSIGSPFEEGVTEYEQGIKFDFSEIGGTMLITIPDPTKLEIQQISKGLIKLALVEIDDEVLFVLSKYGMTPWMEAPFNTNLSQLRILSNINIPEPPPKEHGYSLITFLVNANNGIIKEIRQTATTNEFSNDFREKVIRQSKFYESGISFDKNNYNRKIDDISKHYKQGDMLKLTKKIYEL